MATLIEKLRERTRAQWTDAQRRVAEFEQRGGLDQLTSTISERLQNYEARLSQAQYSLQPDYQRDLGQWYARLELDRSATVQDVKAAYQRLMRLYHPDRYSGEPEHERAATTLSQELSVAKKGLISHLQGFR